MTDQTELTTTDRVLAAIQTMFPREFQIALLTVENERMAGELQAAAMARHPSAADD